MTTKLRIWRIQLFSAFSALRFLFPLAICLVPVGARADGCFVMPPFVWDKHRDINEPTQKAILVHDGRQEDLLLQVKYGGPVNDFGWLIPTPTLPTVQPASMECFYELSRYTQQIWERGYETHAGAGSFNGAASHGTPEPVKVIEIKTVGEYQIAVLSAQTAGSLQAWLGTNHFSFPRHQAEAIESYVKRQWYFVAVRIHLGDADAGASGSPKPAATSSSVRATRKQLAQGELHPLHLHFQTVRCVFPLKISSVNGRPSEVQVYVLAPEGLLEKRLWEKQRTKAGRIGRPSNQALRYAQVTGRELPCCARQLPSLRAGTWWLSKDTWTFKPAEMQDLIFEPIIPMLREELAGNAGYDAACELLQCGPVAEGVLRTALESPNANTRVATAAAIVRASNNVKLLRPAADRLNDSLPEVRLLAENAMLRLYFLGEATAGYTPRLLQMLAEEPPASRMIALEILINLGAAIPRAEVLSFFRVPEPDAVFLAYGYLRTRGLTCDEAAPLMKNASPYARSLGLNFLKQTRSTRAIELAMPLLRDRDPAVRATAQKVLQSLTAQSFPLKYPEKWERWWAANKDHFKPNEDL